MNIFLDMDGVLVDWLSAACHLLKIDPTDSENRKLLKQEQGINQIVPKSDMWKEIDKAGEEFWANLQPFPWAADLIKLAYGVTDRVSILTSPSNNYNSVVGKLQSKQKHFRKLPILIGQDKSFCAHQNAMLIDDTSKKINSFNKAGGIGYLFPNQYMIEDGEIPINNLLDKIDYIARVANLQWNWTINELEDLTSYSAGNNSNGALIQKESFQLGWDSEVYKDGNIYKIGTFANEYEAMQKCVDKYLSLL